MGSNAQSMVVEINHRGAYPPITLGDFGDKFFLMACAAN